jgi:hypothetical protein
MRQAVVWLTPIFSARRTLEMPLSDCSCSQKPVSHFSSGSLVAWSGVFVVAVNCFRQARSEH